MTLEMLTAFLQAEKGDVCFSITADSFVCTDTIILIRYSNITSNGRETGYRRAHMMDLLTFVWSQTK